MILKPKKMATAFVFELEDLCALVPEDVCDKLFDDFGGCGDCPFGEDDVLLLMRRIKSDETKVN